MNEPVERWLAARWTDPHEHQRRHEPEWWFLVSVAVLLTVLILALLISAAPAGATYGA